MKHAWIGLFWLASILPAQAQQKTGELVPFELSGWTTEGSPSREVVEFSGASFLRIHFALIELDPGDKLEIRNGDDAVVQTFEHQPLADAWSTLLYRSPAQLVLRSADGSSQPFYQVDQLNLGDSGFDLAGNCAPDCNQDNVECFNPGEEFENARSVARFHFMIGGDSFTCTGWMVGSPDCLITNWHCINGVEVNTMMAEFDFECRSCQGNDGCKPTTTFAVESILGSNNFLDYALLDMAGSPGLPPSQGGFGFLRVTSLPPEVGTPMYEIHHGRAKKKGIDFGTFTGIAPPGPNPCNLPPVQTEVSYSAIASVGASGSPLFCAATDRVEGICHCGPAAPVCAAGFGIPMSAIVPEIIPLLDAHGCDYNIFAVPCVEPAPATSGGGLLVLGILLVVVSIAVITQRRFKIAIPK